MAIALRVYDVTLAGAGGPVTLSKRVGTAPLSSTPPEYTERYATAAEAVAEMAKIDDEVTLGAVLMRMLFERAKAIDPTFGATFQTALKRTITVNRLSDNFVTIA